MRAEDLIKGRPISLTVLDYGLFKVHANGRVIGIVGFLIRTDAGENILVDTGFPTAYAQDHMAASLVDGLGSFGVVLEMTERHMPRHAVPLRPVPEQALLRWQPHRSGLSGGLGVSRRAAAPPPNACRYQNQPRLLPAITT
jgi:hypothetical protein